MGRKTWNARTGLGMSGLDWQSPYIIYDMKGLWRNYINNPLDVKQWRNKCQSTIPLSLTDTWLDLYLQHEGVQRLFKDHDPNSYTLKRLNKIRKVNNEHLAISNEIYNVLTDTGRKRAFMYVLIDFGMRKIDPIAVEDCFVNRGLLERVD